LTLLDGADVSWIVQLLALEQTDVEMPALFTKSTTSSMQDASLISMNHQIDAVGWPSFDQKDMCGQVWAVPSLHGPYRA
jgi:hypothetical protein